MHPEKNNPRLSPAGYSLFCGERGIRTPGAREGTTVFETAPFDHSGISPGWLQKYIFLCDI
jgi:hypothetical protein